MLSNVGSQTFATRTSIYHSVEQKQFMTGRGHFWRGRLKSNKKNTKLPGPGYPPNIRTYIYTYIDWSMIDSICFLFENHLVMWIALPGLIAVPPKNHWPWLVPSFSRTQTRPWSDDWPLGGSASMGSGRGSFSRAERGICCRVLRFFFFGGWSCYCKSVVTTWTTTMITMMIMMIIVIIVLMT